MAVWALLIGINFYVGKRHLKGAVRDVEDIEVYLEANHKSVTAFRLTASASTDTRVKLPTEEPSVWPTFANMIARLDTVANACSAGDYLYIHYAGHGTREPTVSPEYEEHNSSDFTLVLFDENHGARYLRGLDLARLLQRITERGVKVTVVLDCCYSGSVSRRDGIKIDDVRGIDWDPSILNVYPANDARDSLSSSQSVTRDARWHFNWLRNTSKFTILTACGPHEKAYEGELDGLKHGVLSFFLLSALRLLAKSNVNVNHDAVYGYLCAKMHADHPDQHPMLMGNRASSFLGDLQVKTLDETDVFEDHNGKLHIRIGHAHGVHKGDEYEVYPFDFTPSQRDLTTVMRRVKVAVVKGDTSEVEEIQERNTTENIETGWKARLSSYYSTERVRVSLPSHLITAGDWEPIIEATRFLEFVPENLQRQSCPYSVMINEHNMYEVLSMSGQGVTNVPTVSVNAARATTSVLRLLEHISKYKQIERLENRNPSQSFENSFRINILDSKENTSKAAGILEVQENDILKLIFYNKSSDPLYLTLYYLSPLWQIEGLAHSGGGGDYWVIQPQDDTKHHTGKKPISMQMVLPKELKHGGQMQCEDLIKVFVTSQPVSFKTLTLPKIRDIDQRSMRGESDQLSRFLTDLALPHRGERKNVPLEAEWTTRSYIIRITVQSSESV